MIGPRRVLRRLWRQITWRLFASYLVVGLAAIAVLGIAGTIFASSYVSAHVDVAAMPHFRLGLFQGLVVATIAAIATSVMVSLFVSQRIVEPLHQLMDASRRIASGHYDERVPVRDDFEVTQLAVSFNQMADALERTEERRQALIADVAHELRTPLTSIKGYMEALMDGVMPADDQTFSLIYNEADRMYRLVRDLQELSRLEAGQLELNLHPILVADLVRGVVDRARPQFDIKGIRIVTGVQQGDGLVLGDGDRLFQVLLNLVTNAMQYTPAGGTVNIVSFRERDRLCIAVKDSGMGIAPEHLGHIFGRFYRVDKSRSRIGGGTGIGLTIAKYLVEEHGGSIAAASVVGLGSTFTIALPEWLPDSANPRPAPRLHGQPANG